MIALVLAAVLVGPGIYRPAFPASPVEREVPVARFRLDTTPVTNAQFAAFVARHPEWRKDRVKALYADEGYLTHPGRPNAPVVGVSWFAARAYCAARNGRLPLEKEWELAAAASERSRDATKDPAFQDKILAWYAQLAPAVLPDVGGKPNAWGVSDLHGLVWEWIEDFNAAAPEGGLTCGGAGANSRDPATYATFMRIAFRSSLEARTTTAMLGFRCAYDA